MQEWVLFLRLLATLRRYLVLLVSVMTKRLHRPGLVVHSICNGYWFCGRPSFYDLWRDLRAATAEIRPDWDLSTPGCARPGTSATTRSFTDGTGVPRASGYACPVRDLGLWLAAICGMHPADMDQASVGPVAHGELTRLDRAESLRLLASAPAGRLIFTVNALPVVRLMNFVLADGLIVMRTAPGTTMARRIDDVIVTFEADELDPATSSGWSVTVTGRAALVSEPAAVARYRTVPLVPWAPGVRDQFVTITTELVEGQRLRRTPGS